MNHCARIPIMKGISERRMGMDRLQNRPPGRDAPDSDEKMLGTPIAISMVARWFGTQIE